MYSSFLQLQIKLLYTFLHKDKILIFPGYIFKQGLMDHIVNTHLTLKERGDFFQHSSHF